ncbi:hypothetical protein K461DRAFT_254882 [Myriangium duriaei CBS 260.36]|uniref:Peptidase S54 rhomboid domain-containing protein n=1 Tax=Myriangium duriaei CBS 260.36 TaxID=1168546 RepID=A0A9P4J1W3_9PEZI|nr:hypothetical protein K461DRAFT_254882 [Myriangium duriaei CBS 260.36]
MRSAVCLTSGILRATPSLQVNSSISLGLQQCRRFTRWTSFGEPPCNHETSIRIPRTFPPSCNRIQPRSSIPARSFSQSSGHNKSPKKQSDKKPVATEEPQTDQPQLTWRDYDPEGGFPLPEGDLSPSALSEIFSSPIDPDTGNWILRLMNYRRHSGSLIDLGITFPSSQGISPESAFAALQYLRKVQPELDESAAGIAWAESEIAALSEPYVARAEKLGLYRRTDDDAVEPEEQTKDDVYGPSQLLAMKKSNQAAYAAEEAARAEQAKREEEAALTAAKANINSSSSSTTSQDSTTGTTSDDTALASSGATSRATLARRSRAAWVAHYAARAQLSSATSAPEMSLTRRLGPSLLVTLATLAFCLVLHEAYVSPPDSARMYPSYPASVMTLGALVGMQLLVAVGYRIPQLWRVYNKYFVIVAAQPRASGMVLASFTHHQFSHWFWNAVLLVAFGRYLHDDTSRGTLLAIFLATGTASNFLSLATHVLRRNFSVYTYGSSSAVYGVVTATCLFRADHDVTLFGYHLPMTGLLFLGFFALLDGIAFLRGGAVAKSINFAGHFAGFVTGGLCALGIRWENARGKEDGAKEGAEGKAEEMSWTEAIEETGAGKE